MLSPSTCPYCGRRNEAHAPTGNDYEVPEEGDISICWKCRNIGIFQANGSVRKATPKEEIKLRNAPEIRDALMVMGKAQGPTVAADILRTAERWEPGKLQ